MSLSKRKSLTARSISAVLCALVLLLCICTPSRSYADSAIDTSASAMILVEMQSGQVIASQNENEPLPMASTTKIMTALLVIENADLSDMVKIPDAAVGIEGSSMYLNKGEVVSVEDLLYGLMLSSGNDAAVALAMHVAGSAEAFVELMNKKAEELGLTSTHFVTPNGLHADSHYTTAKELAAITRSAMSYEEFREVVSTQYHTTATGERVRTLKNKNALLWDYDGAFGVKTGYTSAAGRCLVFGAEKDGMGVIGVLLNCRPMFEVASQLMDYAFENYSVCSVVDMGAYIADVIIENGDESILELTAKEGIMTLVKKGEACSFTTQIEIVKGIEAPVSKGDILGRLLLYKDGEQVAQTGLVAAHDIKGRGFEFYWKALLTIFTG